VAYLNTSARAGGFSRDGSELLLGTDSGAVELVRVAEIEEKLAAAKGVAPGTLTSGEVRVDPLTVVVPGGHVGTVWSVAASPDGRWFATASHDQTVKLWDAQSLRLVRTLTSHETLVWCVAFSPDSKYLASGSAGEHSGDIRVWEVETGAQKHHFQEHKALVAAVAFHPTRPWLVSSALDGSIYLWDLEADRSLGLLHRFDRSVYSLAFRPDGRWLAVAVHDHRIALWDMDRSLTPPAPPDRFLTGHTGPVWSVGFSADGRHLASGSEQGVIRLWDGATFDPVATLRGATGQIRTACFSRDGELLAGAGYAPLLTTVWDLAAVRRTLAEMGLDW
jgi:WD40 repeat protein